MRKFYYLCIVNKDKKIIAILTDQLGLANATIATLTARVAELSASLKQLSEALSARDENEKKKDETIALLTAEIKKLQKLVKLLGGKQSEKVTEEEKAEQDKGVGNTSPQGKPKKERKPRAKTNNGARHNPHIECETVEQHVYPDDPMFDIAKAYEMGTRECTRYELIPMTFRKVVYILHSYNQKGEIYNAKAPFNAIFKSRYTPSFVAGIMQLRFCCGMSVERIVSHFTSCGFELDKSTAHHLLKRGYEILENLYKCLGIAVKEDNFMNIDETFHKILEENSKTGKMGVRGYIWAALSYHSQLAYFFYDDGSRAKKVALSFLNGYNGAFQSDGLAVYRTLGGDQYPGLKRLPCLQHIKRAFKEEGSKEGKELFDLFNKLYRYDHKHKVGEDNWTEEQQLAWRQEYAPDILKQIKARLDELELVTRDEPSRKELHDAITYALNEWRDIPNIFTEGFYTLDNNAIERMQRRISLSRRVSFFFGSHEGAKRGAMYHSIATSCENHGINVFDYICDVLTRAAQLPPNTPIENFRDMLPDRWKPAN